VQYREELILNMTVFSLWSGRGRYRGEVRMNIILFRVRQRVIGRRTVTLCYCGFCEGLSECNREEI
jgi:hypothetical protein